MKQFAMIVAAAFIIIAGSACCRNVETGSTPKQYKLTMPAGLYTMHLYQGAEQYSEVTPRNGIYNIHIPSMGGGYSQCLGIKYNVHNPNEYKILMIKKGSAVYREYSIREIEALPEQEGIRELPL
ncbi:MAG TPA: hypothetical protein PK253_17080 [Spirochaetota bacterium]|nr:hypothetical protein [Spirochaetota bacterium]